MNWIDNDTDYLGVEITLNKNNKYKYLSKIFFSKNVW